MIQVNHYVLICSPIWTMFDVCVIINHIHSEFCNKKESGAWLYTAVLQYMDEKCRNVNIKHECAENITLKKRAKYRNNSIGKSLQLLYILPFGILCLLCLTAIRIMFVKIILAVCMLVGIVV